jgi:hypothetical protein
MTTPQIQVPFCPLVTETSVSSGPPGPRPKSTPPSVGESTELVTVINLSDDDSPPPDRRPARTQQPSRKHYKSRACLLRFCSQRVMGNRMAAAVKHFSFAHLHPGPRTVDYSTRVLDCLCSMLGVSGYKGLILQGHPLLTTGFKLSEEDRTIASD